MNVDINLVTVCQSELLTLSLFRSRTRYTLLLNLRLIQARVEVHVGRPFSKPCILRQIPLTGSLKKFPEVVQATASGNAKTTRNSFILSALEWQLTCSIVITAESNVWGEI